jgi:iron complex transport system permease protein
MSALALSPLPRRALLVTGALLAFAAACMLYAGMTGSITVAAAELPAALRQLADGRPQSLAASLIELRAGRALVAFVTGGALALAGVLMQALLRNPLADPYILGISAGASVGALAALLLMAAAAVVDAAALAGAVTVSMLLYLLARRDLRGGAAAEGGTSMLLLTGVILSSLCMAMVTLMLSIAPEGRLRSMVFWMIGDLAGAPVRLLPWLVLGGALAFALHSARAMNVLALHAEAAVTLGVRVGALRKGLFFRPADGERGHQRRFGRLRRPDRPACLPLRLRPGSPRPDPGGGAGRRQFPGAVRYAGAYRGRATAAAGRRDHRHHRRASIPVPAAPLARIMTGHAIDAIEHRGYGIFLSLEVNA